MLTLTKTELAKYDRRNQYGELDLDFVEVVQKLYPKIKITSQAPGCWGSDGEAWVRETEGDRWELCVPDGKYTSGRHYHTAHTAVMAIESSRKKLNLAGCPLILISTTAYNGDYRSLKKSYFLFGKNEDNSYFTHKIRPRVGETGDLDAVRNWIWQTSKAETIAARQGDLAFIPKTRKFGKLQENNSIALGNHQIRCDRVYTTKYKVYVENPHSTHHEHNSVALKGLFELRLAKAWQASSAD